MRGTSLINLDTVLAEEARKIFRFIDTENKGEVDRDKIFSLVRYLQDENKEVRNAILKNPDDSDGEFKAELHPVLNKLERLAKATNPEHVLTEDSFALYFCLCKDSYANMKDETQIVFEQEEVTENSLAAVKSLNTKVFKKMAKADEENRRTESIDYWYLETYEKPF
jgi:hypothetical protein